MDFENSFGIGDSILQAVLANLLCQNLVFRLVKGDARSVLFEVARLDVLFNGAKVLAT